MRPWELGEAGRLLVSRQFRFVSLISQELKLRTKSPTEFRLGTAGLDLNPQCPPGEPRLLGLRAVAEGSPAETTAPQ